MKLYCREAGSGKPMVLLHGNGEDSSYFEHQITHFSKKYHVIAVDTRGHGKSPRGTARFTLNQFAADLKKFLDQRGLNRILLLGFSDGGNIALLFTRKYPDCVERLILNGANLNPWGVKLSVQLPILAGYGLVSALKKAEDLFCFGRESKQGELIKKKELLGLMVKEPHIAKKSLTGLRMPVLVIAGTHDMIRTSHTKAIAAALPNGCLCFVEGDHFIAHERPEAFNRAVDAFLDTGAKKQPDLPEQMKKCWGNRMPGRLDWKPGMDYSVLVPLVEEDGEYRILFEIRSAKLKSQPGEVCFPGGAVETGETNQEAAVREAMEELLIERSQIELLAALDVLVTPSGPTVRPYLGVIRNYRGTFSEDEVERTFTVPLKWFMEHEPEMHDTEVVTVPGEDFPFDLVPGGREYHWRKGKYRVLFYRNENAVIWGMTAKILHSFILLYRESF